MTIAQNQVNTNTFILFKNDRRQFLIGIRTMQTLPRYTKNVGIKKKPQLSNII